MMKIRKNPEKSGKIRENPEKYGNRMNFRKIDSSYSFWEVNHPFCEEIWSKPLIYEDLRRIMWKKKKEVNL